MPWVQDPSAGGVKISKNVQERIRKRILDYAEKNYKGKYTRLDIRFLNQFCYIDAYAEPHVPPDFPPPDYPESREEYITRLRNTPTHLCRLRHYREDSFSVAFYKYSDMKYEIGVFGNGSFYGTPEGGVDVGAVYLEGF
jgi:hypothetical protein